MELKALLQDMSRLETGAWSDRLLQAGHARRAEGDRGRGRHTALLRTALEEWLRHDWVLNARLSRPPRPRVRAALRLGLVLLEGGHAPHAVLSALLSAMDGVSPAERGLINAVLRGLLRDDRPLAPLPVATPAVGDDAKHTLGIALSLPPWFLDLVERVEGPEALRPRFLHGLRRELFQGRGLWLRVNPSRWSPAEALAQLNALGLGARAAPEHAAFLRLERAPQEGLDRLPALADGSLRVQDLSAWGALELLDVRAGHRVLDVCAAPGGKALAMLDMYPGLDLTVVEADAARARALARRLEGRARLLVADGRSVPAGGWDRILLDVPCSGSGTIGHRPEILLKRDPVTAALLELQRSLLAHAAGILAPGGRLVYSTCSLDPRENEEQVQALLQKGEFRTCAEGITPAALDECGIGWRWRPWTGISRPGRPGAGGAWAAALERRIDRH